MHKKCDGCKALQYEKCLLGYEITYKRKVINVGNGNMETLKFSPIKQCPKPLTYKKYIECMENLRSYNPWDEEEQ